MPEKWICTHCKEVIVFKDDKYTQNNYDELINHLNEDVRRSNSDNDKDKDFYMTSSIILKNFNQEDA